MAKEKSEKSNYGIVFTFGLSVLIMLLLCIFLYPSMKYGDMKVIDLFIVTSVGFGVGVGVAIILIFVAKINTDFNLLGFAIWFFTLFLLLFCGSTIEIGDIYMGQLLTILAITLVVTAVAGFILIGISKII